MRYYTICVQHDGTTAYYHGTRPERTEDGGVTFHMTGIGVMHIAPGVHVTWEEVAV